jgi:hypothetical protein
MPRQKLAIGNEAFDWNAFDPEAYVASNYMDHVRDDDRRILQLVRDYFASQLDPRQPVAIGGDVGSGANLYPAFTMLPFCRQVVLYEHGRANVQWLEKQLPSYAGYWDHYWHILQSRGAYDSVADPRHEFARKATVQKDSLFNLGQRRWDLATMFFVAESITDQENEFRTALRQFIRVLKPGAPFAAAFMENSSGYYVGSRRFPAVLVDRGDITHYLTPLADKLDVIRVKTDQPLRDDHHAMVLALGTAAGGARS